MRIPGTDPQTTLHALFPTLVYQSVLKQHDDLKAAFESEFRQTHFQTEASDGSQHFAGEYHGQILLHQQPLLRPFFEELSLHVAEYLKALGMKPEFFDLQLLKSWFVRCEADSDEEHALMTHNHSCSDVSWVYYYDVPDDCPPIRFQSGGSLNSAPFGSAFHYDWHDDQKSSIKTCNWWNSDAWTITPKNGDVLIFPGHQLHSVDANHTDQKRITVAGDLALTLKPQFQNLEFGRTAPEHWLTLPLE